MNEYPKTLDKTYDRTLLGISGVKREYAQRLFRCLAVSIRPLRVEEVAEILAIRFDETKIPTFNASWRPENAEEAVISACSSLIAVVNRGGHQVVQFSHFSIKEYLTSDRLTTAEEPLSYYHILPEPAHTLLARACLSVLVQLDDKIDRDAIAHFPLAPYAARHWVDHAQFGNASVHLQEVMERLFDAAKPHFSAWVWLYDIDRYWTEPMSDVHPTRPEAVPLYYASLCGFHGLVEHLIVTDSRDVYIRGGSHTTPLHAASVKGHFDVAVLLLKNGANPNSHDDRGRAPLHRLFGKLIVEQLSLDIARALVISGANVNITDYEGQTPLHLASRQDEVGVAQLIECDGDVDITDDEGDTQLCLASRQNEVEVPLLLTQCGGDVTAQNKDGWNPLHLALSGEHAELVRIFIQHGATGIAQGKDKWTSSHRIQFREYIGVAQILFDHGADVTAQDRCGLFPLHLASGGHVKLALILLEHSTDATVQNWLGWTGEHVELTRILLEHGAVVDARDNDNCTPLHWASEQAHPEVVRFLLERGVDADARDNDNSTPLHCASQQGHLEVVRVLVKHGVDVNVRDHTNWTPLHGASLYGHLEVVQFLLEHGANPHASDQGGWTPLQWPSYNGDPEIVRILLKHGADANTRDNSNWTPLHGASQQGHWEVVQVLLEHGADPNSHDNNNQTPLDLASRAGHPGLAELIKSRANIDVRNNEGRTPIEEVVVSGDYDIMQLTLLLVVALVVFLAWILGHLV